METVREYPPPTRGKHGHYVCPLCHSELEEESGETDDQYYYECSFCDYYFVSYERWLD